jgi:hypothetical protein
MYILGQQPEDGQHSDLLAAFVLRTVSGGHRASFSAFQHKRLHRRTGFTETSCQCSSSDAAKRARIWQPGKLLLSAKWRIYCSHIEQSEEQWPSECWRPPL